MWVTCIFISVKNSINIYFFKKYTNKAWVYCTYQPLGLSVRRAASPIDLRGHFSSGTYCSHVTPKDLVSDGNILHMSFFTNDKVVDTGFTATWRAVDPSQGKTGERWQWNTHWGNSPQVHKSISLTVFSPPPLTHTQLLVEGASAVIRVKLSLLIGPATTQLSLCARGVSPFLQQKLSM